MQTLKEKYNKEVVPEMMKRFHYKTPMAVPRILKVVINSGIGKLRDKKDAVEIADFETLVSSGIVVSKAEKDYQQLIIKKQK